MVRIGLRKGNSFEITAVPCVSCQVSKSKDTLLFLYRTWFGSSIQHNCQTQYISQPPAWTPSEAHQEILTL